MLCVKPYHLLIFSLLLLFQLPCSWAGTSETDDLFYLGEAQVYGKREAGLEIEEIGDTSIPEYIYKRDLYTSKEEEGENVLKKIEAEKQREDKNRNLALTRSRFLKRSSSFTIGSFGTLRGALDFDIRNGHKDNMQLKLHALKSDGYRKNQSNRRFATDFLWQREMKESGEIELQAGFGFQKRGLPGPKSKIQTNAEVEDAIRNIILSYELAKNVSDRIRFSATHKNRDRDLTNSGLSEKQKAQLNQIEVEYFTFIKNRYSVHFGASYSDDKIKNSSRTDINLNHNELYAGLEGMFDKDWTYFFGLKRTDYKELGSRWLPEILVKKKMSDYLVLSLGYEKDITIDSSHGYLDKFEDLNITKMAMATRNRTELSGKYTPTKKSELSLGIFSESHTNYPGINEKFDPILGIHRYRVDPISDADISGVTAGVQHKLNSLFTFSSDLLFQWSNDDSVNNRVPLIPEYLHSFKLRYKNRTGWNAEAMKVIRGSYLTETGNSDTMVAKTNLTHMGVGYIKDEHLHFDFRIRNVYDKHYQIRFDQPAPGREFQLQMRYIY